METNIKEEVLKLPLKVGGIMSINGDNMRRIDESDGMVMAFVTDQNLIESEAVKIRDANADFIVRAVNSYEALLEALMKSHEILTKLSFMDNDGSIDKLTGKIKSLLEIKHRHVAKRDVNDKLLDVCGHCGRDIRETIHSSIAQAEGGN